MKNTVRCLVVAWAFGLSACGGKASNSDGGPDGAAGNVASGGRGGTTGAGGAVGGDRGGRGGGGGAHGGTTGGGGGVGSGGTTGTAGASAGAAGAAGGGGGGAGRGGALGTAGSTGSGGAGGTPGGRCTAPADCGSAAAGVGFCSGTTWSCVDGACTAECMGGRTCTEAPDSGCLLCRTASSTTPMSQGCVGTACVFVAGQVRETQRSTGCESSNTPDFATWHCTGQWASLAGSNTPCTIQNVPTDAVRYSISCGSCVTVVTLGN